VNRAAAGVFVALWALLGSAGAVGAQQAGGPGFVDPCTDSSADWCLESDEPAEVGAPTDPGNGGGPGQPAPECGWANVPESTVPLPTSSRPYILTNGRPPEGLEVVWQGWCYDADAPGFQYFRGPFRWLPVGEPVPVLTPEDVAAEAYDRLQGRMPDPAVVTNPAPGVDAVVGVPVFVTVTNWQSQLVETDDLLGDLVTVQARPVAVVEPGEPDAPAVTCDGPGRGYDPAAGDLWAQAASPGACTATYHRRTGVDGRPDEWASVVTVRWSIQWWSESGGGGEFPDVSRSVAIPRGVDEVQTVVVDGGGG
jgi:hypothetical protein